MRSDRRRAASFREWKTTHSSRSACGPAHSENHAAGDNEQESCVFLLSHATGMRLVAAAYMAATPKKARQATGAPSSESHGLRSRKHFCTNDLRTPTPGARRFVR